MRFGWEPAKAHPALANHTSLHGRPERQSRCCSALSKPPRTFTIFLPLLFHQEQSCVVQVSFFDVPSSDPHSIGVKDVGAAPYRNQSPISTKFRMYPVQTFVHCFVLVAPEDFRQHALNILDARWLYKAHHNQVVRYQRGLTFCQTRPPLPSLARYWSGTPRIWTGQHPSPHSPDTLRARDKLGLSEQRLRSQS